MSKSKFIVFVMLSLATQAAKAQEVNEALIQSEAQAVAETQEAPVAAEEREIHTETSVRSHRSSRDSHLPFSYNAGGSIGLGRGSLVSEGSSNAGFGTALRLDGELLTTRTPVPYRVNMELDSTLGAGGSATHYQIGGSAEFPSEIQVGVDYRHLSVRGNTREAVNTVGLTAGRTLSLNNGNFVLNGNAGFQLGGSHGDNGSHAAVGLALSGTADFNRQIAQAGGLTFTINPHFEYDTDMYISNGIVNFRNMEAALNFCAQRNRSHFSVERYCAGLVASMQTARTPDDHQRNTFIGLQIGGRIGGGSVRRAPAAPLSVQEDYIAEPVAQPEAQPASDVPAESNVTLDDEGTPGSLDPQPAGPVVDEPVSE